MKKKIVALCLVVALALTAVGGATLAYFTDKDQVNNTFAIGNINIDLYEKTDNEVPGMEKDHEYQSHLDYSNIMPGDVLSKKPFIRNESEVNSAYVRVFVLINNHKARNLAIDEVYEAAAKKDGLDKTAIQNSVQSKYTEIFDGWGINNTAKKDNIAGYDNVIRNSMAQRTSDVEGVEIIKIDSARIPYVGAGYQYETWNLFQTEAEVADQGHNNIAKDNGYYKNAIEEDCNLYVFYLKLEPGKQYQLFNGLNVPAEFDAEQMKMFEGLKIDIYADAIQVDNFDSAEDAFNALEAANPMGWWNAT